MAINETRSVVWADDHGNDLVRWNPTKPEAYIAPANCNAEKLLDLAEACRVCAEAMQARAREELRNGQSAVPN